MGTNKHARIFLYWEYSQYKRDQDEGYGDIVSKSFDIFERPGQFEANT